MVEKSAQERLAEIQLAQHEAQTQAQEALSQEQADWPAKMRRAGFFEGIGVIARGKEIGTWDSQGMMLDHLWWMIRMGARVVGLGVMLLVGLILLGMIF